MTPLETSLVRGAVTLITAISIWRNERLTTNDKLAIFGFLSLLVWRTA